MSARRVGAASANWASKILRSRGAGGSQVFEAQATLRSTLSPCQDPSSAGAQSFAAQGLQSHSCPSSQASLQEEAATAPVSIGNEAEVKVNSEKRRYRPVELLAAFTCNKCGARTARGFSKVAYQRGVVIARCGKCDVQHLLSDQLGWFGEKGNIEDILREKGQGIRKYVDDEDVLQLTPEDLTGWSKEAPGVVTAGEGKQ